MCVWQLETRLAEKEEQLLEKDLVFEQVQRLVERIRNKAQAGKDDTLTLAKRVRPSASCRQSCLLVQRPPSGEEKIAGDDVV